MRGGLFHYLIPYFLDKYKFINPILSIITIWLILKMSAIIIHTFDLPLNVYIGYWWIVIILIIIVMLISNFILDNLFKILKKYDINILSENNIDKGKFLKEKWLFYPLKWYLLWVLIFIDIYALIYLQNEIISFIPQYLYNFIIWWAFSISMLQIVPIKITFYSNGVNIGGRFYNYNQIKILDKEHKKVVLINNIPKYMFFDKNKYIDYIFKLNDLENILITNKEVKQ
ncbi:MAG: hypothetical protein PWP15_306 [Methanothermococcus sp.]|jgi:hypothetical protein|uniref:hypothetical protein n=1 Tax=Methanothermococcus TaxID=155862 RepID=UPI0003727978|nr:MULTISPECIES: hypothetical protein [Methanothermococcus]MDK2789799.1 hypothetical protein [Methanothermococcus sp.]MDK2987243.1 hypothetical protein [Methanothermococcus sp.]